MKEITEEEALAELTADLEAAVAARVTEVSGWTRGRLTAEAERCGDILAGGGDAILFPPEPKRMTKREMAKPTVAELTKEQVDAGVLARDFTPVELWGALTTALAIGALVPGGADWMGMHYCTAPHKACPAGNLPSVAGEEAS